MPPTFSARIDEEKVEELKEKSGVDGDSAALRSAVEYAVNESRKEQLRLLNGLFLFILGASHYVEFQIDPAFAQVALVGGFVLFEYQFLRRLFSQVMTVAQSD